MTTDIIRVLAGLVLLTLGAEGLVRGAGALARRIGVSALVVGLSVVAFGTSAPEVAVSVEAAMTGRGEVALGNVVGSNIFNVLFILGVSALITPLVVQRQLVKIDGPIMVGVAFLPLVMALDGGLGRFDGLVLLSLLVAYLLLLGWLSVRERHVPVAGGAVEVPKPAWPWPVDLVLGGVGLAFLIYGAGALVEGASALARAAGVSELVIGLTLVAAGTSLPEVATSVVASLRGERDLAVGNVVGSNIFNVLAVLGVSATASGSLPVPIGVLTFDFPLMIAVAVVCLPVFATGGKISRREGAAFIVYYGLYLTWLGLHTTDHGLKEEFGFMVLAVLLPLTVAAGIANWTRRARKRRHARGEFTEH